MRSSRWLGLEGGHSLLVAGHMHCRKQDYVDVCYIPLQGSCNKLSYNPECKCMTTPSAPCHSHPRPLKPSTAFVHAPLQHEAVSTKT